VNRVLEKVFVGESGVLVDLLKGKRLTGYRTGVSLIALLRREPGVGALRLVPGRSAAA
jgi:hypothetical protein